MSQKQYQSHYADLKNKWTDRHKKLQDGLWEKHQHALQWLFDKTKYAAVTSLSSAIMLASNGGMQIPTLAVPSLVDAQEKLYEDISPKVFLINDLAASLPETVRELTPAEEAVIGQTLSRHFGFYTAVELQGKRLNRSYGLIGAEQHLMRYPGDVMETHFDNEADAKKYWSSGMAPGRGAWGYFAPSKAEMTQQDVDHEKYYIAVQTFLAPGWGEHTKEYYNFFKYRKMLVINPHNGKAVIAVIGDAGPAQWTGKSLGGSPEVMKHLERVDGSAKGPVLYFFIDDPQDEIPLGPIEPIQ